MSTSTPSMSKTTASAGSACGIRAIVLEAAYCSRAGAFLRSSHSYYVARVGSQPMKEVGMRRTRRKYGDGLELRRGDIVTLRSPSEILATLDDSGSLDGLPFMPEMLAYFGRQFPVASRVERACDTITYAGARRMLSTVILDELRCNGSGHGGCQAGCRISTGKRHGFVAAAARPPQPLRPTMASSACAMSRCRSIHGRSGTSRVPPTPIDARQPSSFARPYPSAGGTRGRSCGR